MNIRLPELGEEVSTEWALELGQYFGLTYLVDRITKNPDKYKPWKFDGCSGVPDRWLSFLTGGCKWEEITYRCCLPHDLKYAYGDRHNKEERKRVDTEFLNDLSYKVKKMKRWIARIFYRFVRVLGIYSFDKSYVWAFAEKEEHEP